MNTLKLKMLLAIVAISTGVLAQSRNIEEIGSLITKETALAWTEKFKKTYNQEVSGSFYGKQILKELLALEGMAGLYVFNGLDSDGVTRLIFKAVDENGEVIFNNLAVDQGQLCPPACHPRQPIPSIGKRVEESQAQTWINNFQSAHKERTYAQLFGKAIFEKILSQPQVDGMYLANGLDDDGNERLVLIGVDFNGNTMWDGPIADQGQLCPPNCPRNGYPSHTTAENKSQK